MAQTDNFAFAKSEEVQGVSRYSPYQKKVWNNLSDINSGVYSNTTQSLVQFDLSSIYNSGSFTDSADLFLALPIINVAECTTAAGAGVAPSSTAYSLLTLKQGYHQLVHQLELQVSGKIVADSQPFANVARNFKMLSQMTCNDLKNLSASLGMADCLDSPLSPSFFTGSPASGTATSGVGFCNNTPYSASGISNGTQTSITTNQNDGVVNDALAKRIARYTSATQSAYSATSKNIYGAAQTTGGNQPFIATAQTLINEFRPFYTVAATTKSVWYDVAILPLRYLTDVMDKIGLVRKLDCVLRIYVNTGTCVVPVLDPNAATLSLGYPTTNTFTNTCPVTLNYVPSASLCNIPATTAHIAFGCFLARVPTTSLPCGTGTANLSGPASHPLPSCRAYYSQIKLDPSVAQKYITENSAKELVFENYIFNQYNNIGVNNSFSQLISSGLKAPVGCLIVPFISSSQVRLQNGSTTIGFSQYQSPYDTAPATNAPLSLINLQASLGGTSVLDSSSLYYTFENWLEQVSIAETVVPELGLNQGILSQKDWESINRLYYIDLARGSEADKATMRNLSISFTNNSGVAIDIMVFTFYLNRGIINVETGMLTM
jgi:hypothetical protein